MAINIRRGTHIAMSELFLDLLHRHALGKQYRGAGVAKIVEADLLQVMLLQNFSCVKSFFFLCSFILFPILFIVNTSFVIVSRALASARIIA